MDIQNRISGSAGNPDIYFDYIYSQGQDTAQNIKIPYPVIFFMYSGKLTIKCKNKKISVEKGECVFLQANTTATFQTKDCDNESFCGIYIGFNKPFLSEFYNNCYNKKSLPEKDKIPADIMKMPCTPYMQSLYISMIPYLERKIKPEKNVMELKRMECIYCMLTSDPRFYTSLFDFIKPIELNLFYIINKNNLN
ncbi:MAG: hypothetical protein ACLVKO_10385 [Dysgonomonas sp.]